MKCAFLNFGMGWDNTFIVMGFIVGWTNGVWFLSDSDIYALPSHTVNCLAHAVTHLAGSRNFSLVIKQHGAISVFLM